MTRLSARYKHFWAKGFAYQHFWANAVPISPDASVAGSLLPVVVSVNAGAAAGSASASGITLGIVPSLLSGLTAVLEPGRLFNVDALLGSGTAAGNANANGELLTVNRVLFSGTSTIDGQAPINTRLNAAYRHFWNRRQVQRHFWAQWEGGDADIVAGPLVIVLSLLVIGEASSDVNADGVELTIDWSVIDGLATGGATTIPRVLPVNAEIVNGALTTDAHINGVVLTVTTSVLVGTYVPGANIHVDVSLIEGTAEAFAIVDGANLNVDVSLLEGNTAVTVDSKTLTVNVSLIDGQALTTPPDGFSPGDMMVVDTGIFGGGARGEDNSVNYFAEGATQTIIVDLIPGTASIGDFQANGDLIRVNASIISGVFSNGEVFATGTLQSVQVSLIEGIATGETNAQDADVTGALINVQVSIVEGVATGETAQPDVPQSIRAGGPVGSHTKRKKKPEPVNAMVFGITVTSFAAIISGLATGEDNSFPSPSIVPELGVPTVREVVGMSGKAEGASLSSGMSIPEIGKARGEARQLGDVLSAQTWNAYDNDVLEILELV